MAAAFRCSLRSSRNVVNLLSKRHLTFTNKTGKYFPHTGVVCGCIAGTALACYLVKNRLTPTIDLRVDASKGNEQRSEEKRAVLQTQRELRFLSFASVEYEGNVYMTPEDFLESVTEEAPRPRAGRRYVGSNDVETYFKTTPWKGKGSTHMFRNLHNKGLISYTEYLFLLCVLTKPKSGFKIAFNMFDTDGNQRVDKKEFLVCERIIAGVPRDTPTDSEEAAPVQDTTLTVHFFGRKGSDTLKYEDFHRFMDNLQTEVLELEFGEFSRGMKTITEVEFAQILLRYTILSADDHEEYLQRLRSKVQEVKGITFQEFKDFCQFLNNLDDFALAMRMYTYSRHPISQDDFKRAVKACTGQSLSDHLVDVVYKLFDKDGDNHLSHKEFISVMKDRLHRGFRTYNLHQDSWHTFKGCVKNEMRTA